MADDIVIDEDDLTSLRKHAPRKGDTVQSRLKLERPLNGLDGRRARPKSEIRQVPLNVDVDPEIKRLVARARSEHGMSMKVFVAEAIRRYWRELNEGGEQ